MRHPRTSSFLCSSLLACSLAACGHSGRTAPAGVRDDAAAEDDDAASVDGGPGAPLDAASGGSAEDGSDAAARADAASASEPPSSACAQLSIDDAADVGGFTSDVYTWRDARCLPRSAALVHNDGSDPAGTHGGFVRRFVYDVAGAPRTCTGENPTHPGFGFVVAHWGDTATLGHAFAGSFETPLAGKHHALHRYHWPAMSIDGHPVDVTISWFFATGRDHPVWAITYDLSGVPANSVAADTRSPYGDIAWDGGGGHAVSGVGWGDRYRFRSLGEDLSMASGWDYSAPNTIPHAFAWSDDADAEMGLVQTQSYLQHDAGGYWAYQFWGQRNEAGPMPEDWNWTYQINQYELPFTNTSKRLAWGANYGAVGQSSYNAYGDDKQLVGYPYQSYAVLVVLGTHSAGTVDAAVRELEAVQEVKLSASVGSVASEGPAGVARTDTAPYQPLGWDPVHAAWTASAAAGNLTLTLDAPSALPHPVFHVYGLGAGAALTLDGRAQESERDYYASLDARDGSLWLTLARDLTGVHTLSLKASP